MIRKIFNAVGLVLIALAVFGLLAAVIVAARSNNPFYGTNYQGLPLGTYSTLAVLIVAALIGLYAALRRLYSLFKTWRSK